MRRPGGWLRAGLAVAALGLWSGAGAAGAVEWSALADAEVVQVLTRNSDGSTRTTKVWLAVVDGQGYLRTGRTRWYGNLERSPELTLRAEGRELTLRAERVEDAALIERVQAEFRRKYGFADRVTSLFRFGGPRILRLDAGGGRVEEATP